MRTLNNVGTVDRAVRILAGIVLLGLVFVIEGNARWWGIIGIVPLVTGITGVCPLYSMLGISTCPPKPKM